MSVRTAFAVVGTAIGAYFGNPALGYAIGSMVGGYVDPVKNFGPRLTDAQQQTSNDGVPIPIIYGNARLSGNVIASGPLIEHKHKDDGKGSGQVTTTYTYSRTYAIGVCEGPIVGIRRVWRNAKLVYDARDFRTNGVRATSAKFAQMADFYVGDETQTPNSELQAIFGTDYVSAYRGLAYIVVRNDDLTITAGAVPIYEFEVVTVGDVTNPGSYRILDFPVWPPFPSPYGRSDPRDPSGGAPYRYRASADDVNARGPWRDDLFTAVEDQASLRGRPFVAGHIMAWSESNASNVTGGYQGLSGSVYPHDDGAALTHPIFSAYLGYSRKEASDIKEVETLGSLGVWNQCIVFDHSVWALGWNGDAPGSTPAPPISYTVKATMVFAKYEGSEIPDSSYTCFDEGGTAINGVGLYYDYIIQAQAELSCEQIPDESWLPVPDSPGWYVDTLGEFHNVSACTPVSGNFRQLKTLQIGSESPALEVILQRPLGPVLPTGSADDTEDFWTAAYADAVSLGYLPPGLVYNTDYPQDETAACFCSPSSVIESETIKLYQIVADLCRRTGMPADFIDVSALQDEVIGFTVATDSTAADTINVLGPAFQFDGAEWDGKIRFVKRGAGAATSITLDQSVAVDSSAYRITETRAQEVEIPRKITVQYEDPAADYELTTQMAERYVASVKSTGSSQVQIPVVLSTEQAAQIADILLKDKWSALRGTVDETVPDEWSYVTPTDIIFVESTEGAVFRIRVGPVTVGGGTMQYTGTQDLQSAYSSTATGVAPPTPTDTMDEPIGPTLYYPLNLPVLRTQDDLTGFYVAATGLTNSWAGALLEISNDGGATYTPARTIIQPSIVGQLISEMPAWNPDVPDDQHSVDVQIIAGELESITRAALFNQGNGAAAGEQLFQYQNATAIGDLQFRLSGLIRGRKSTYYGALPIGTPFYLLDSLYFVQIDRSNIGRPLTLRMTSSGTATDSAIVKTITLNPPRSVTEWAPTNPRMFRNGSGDIAMAWSPRHRLGDADTPYASTWFTGYQLTVSDGSTSKTYALASAALNYTSAMQTADFGSTVNPLSYTIRAVNSITGAGDALTGTI